MHQEKIPDYINDSRCKKMGNDKLFLRTPDIFQHIVKLPPFINLEGVSVSFRPDLAFSLTTLRFPVPKLKKKNLELYQPFSGDKETSGLVFDDTNMR